MHALSIKSSIFPPLLGDLYFRDWQREGGDVGVGGVGVPLVERVDDDGDAAREAGRDQQRPRHFLSHVR